MAHLENRRIDLVADLQRVPPVDEDSRLPVQHDRHARRAGEAGEPGQPFGAGRDIFALMRVGARDDEALQPVLRQQGAQGRDALGGRAIRRLGRRHARFPAAR